MRRAEKKQGEQVKRTVGRRKGQARGRLQECLGRRRTGPQQYTTNEGVGCGVKKRTDVI